MKTLKKDYILKDGETLVIRTPELGDAQNLIDQMKLVDSETRFLAREEGEFNFSLEQEREFIKNCLEGENRLFLLAEIDGRIIGNCSVGLISNSKRYLHRATMGIAVCKEYWNKSIGGKLMKECVYWCKEKGLEQLELEVVTQNTRAISMYKKFGFQIQGTKKHALKYGDGTYADEFHMILFLDPDGHKLELHYNNLEDRLKWARENDWSSFELNEGQEKWQR